jgi:hypothetical protein
MTDTNKAGFIGYDEQGRFLHYCHCGKWGAYGVGVRLLTGQLGTWYCREHRPPEAKLPVFLEPPPVPVLPDDDPINALTLVEVQERLRRGEDSQPVRAQLWRRLDLLVKG